MIKCPNCGSTAQVKSTGTRNNVVIAHIEYRCGCGCHWIDRYEFMRRDFINEKDN